MGTWDIKPWDNDIGADWFAKMFDETKLAEYTRQTLQNSNPLDDYEEIRAAASLVILLGRVYVWPIEHLNQDLVLAASKLEQILTTPELSGNDEFIVALREEIKKEIRELHSRIK